MYRSIYLLIALGIPTSGIAEEEVTSFEAIEFFENFSEVFPDQSSLYYSLGKSYYEIHAWKKAATNFKIALKLQPENPDAELFLAYSLLFQSRQTKELSETELNKSRELFEEVLKKVPDYADAKAGLKSASKVKDEVIPVHIAAPKKKKKKQGPNIEEVLLAEAKELSSQKNHAGAIELYRYLSEKSPKNAEYLFFLGREYVRAGCRCLGKEAFERSLEIKEDYSDSLIFLGKHYFADKDLCEAKDLFTRAIQSQPKDVAGFVGLARTEALLDNPEDAEALFQIAYEMEPDNVDVVVPFTGFLLDQYKYREAESIYRIYEVNNDDDEIYRNQIFNASAYTRPTFFSRAGTAEEREKDIFSHRWVASLRYYNADAGVIMPISDTLRVTPKIRAGTQRQRLLVSKRTQFDVRSVGAGIKAEWIFDPDWTLIADYSMEWNSNNHQPVNLPAKCGTKILPTLIFRYAHHLDTLVFGETADSIIFRNFAKKNVSVVSRNVATFSYTRDFEDYRYLGCNALWLWYQDPILNQEQDATIFFQAGFPYIEDLLSARYQCDYRHFNHETTGYYSFQYQLTQWLKLRSVKRWLSGAHYELEYWHGWRTTRGRNPQQQLVVGPFDQFFPVTTVENQIDQVFITFGYMPDDNLDIRLGGTYYHDSFDYTIMGAKIQIDLRF